MYLTQHHDQSLNSTSTLAINIRSQSLCILTVPRGIESLVKGERHVTGNCEMVERDINQSLTMLDKTPFQAKQFIHNAYLLSLTSRHVRLDLPQTLADKQRSVDEHTIGGTIDFEVAEQDIGPEERENFIDAVVRLVVRGHIEIGDVGGKRGEGVCGAARASTER